MQVRAHPGCEQHQSNVTFHYPTSTNRLHTQPRNCMSMSCTVMCEIPSCRSGWLVVALLERTCGRARADTLRCSSTAANHGFGLRFIETHTYTAKPSFLPTARFRYMPFPSSPNFVSLYFVSPSIFGTTAVMPGGPYHERYIDVSIPNLSLHLAQFSAAGKRSKKLEQRIRKGL